MAERKPALLFLGLDGVDPTVVDRLRGDGELPVLSRLAEAGTLRPIESTVPAATCPAWATCLTGVNPGRHGVFDFTVADGYEVRFGSPRPAVPTWLEMLGEQGLSVGALGFPGRLHGTRLAGFHVAGWDTPLETEAGLRHVYPPSLYHRIREKLGPDVLQFAAADEFAARAADDPDEFVARLAEGLDRRVALALFLSRERPVDLLAVHFQAADTAGHHLWPRAAEAGAADTVPDGLRRTMRMLDAAVGRLLDELAPAAVVAVSDHGMGPTADLVVSLNALLAAGGFQARGAEGALDQTAAYVRGNILRLLPRPVRDLALRTAGTLLPDLLESRSRFAGIAWPQTRAFSDELTYAPSVRLNVRGREPEGIVEPAGRGAVAAEVAAFLREARRPDGGPLFARVRSREEIYDGPLVDRAPDLLLEPALDAAGRTPLLCPPHLRPRLDGGWWMPIPADGRAGGKGGLLRGAHRPQGIVLAAPAPAWLRKAGPLDLRDVAPLVHGLLERDEPAHLERPRRRAPAPPAAEAPLDPADDGLTNADRRALSRRLAALGYIEEPDR
ncbi:MAG: alkaline phosphatase family protein [Deltaproteobacteria bacterium]|nr:alkaline phosphatase family protein [Deltaproteobacteria bacterium]